ncbi:hypothetical protein DI270_030560 [Microbispora triticiradicis]|uniref:Uncharacterized protein n=1 Tax=Microbispora triticiradicis TaxID=2200763 RepID=A0ABX9LDE9_9ACTN|nr:hypothetical protein DI270_030560 [Microbispora triticiradicis]GLW22607.1 hypothetical protein Mame01_26500 [Microbispora amethystogenes]
MWLFSSGPLDPSADEAEIPPVPQAARAPAALGARGHRTFGGRLARDAEGFLASRIAARNGGDYRDPDRARAPGPDRSPSMWQPRGERGSDRLLASGDRRRQDAIAYGLRSSA